MLLGRNEIKYQKGNLHMKSKRKPEDRNNKSLLVDLLEN